MTDTLTERKRGRPVGQDLRRRAVAEVLEGRMSTRAAGRRFNVAASSVALWVKRYRERGHLRTDPRGVRPSVIDPERERIFRVLEKRPDLSIRALQRALAAEGLVFGASTLQRFLKRHGLQRRRRVAWRRNPASNAAARS
ncbi:MAG: helix-turn-helix domain-containing protein [Alphaproteobacteria bacterium]|nr:helix-turn-helix domain-containing protein [Alphaproteobacteria bacterium]